MRVLFDNGTPRGLAASLWDHVIEEARELLEAAEVAGFDVFVTTDRNLQYQQNLTARRIAIVVLGSGRWRLVQLRLTEIAAAVASASPGSLVEIDIPEARRRRE